MALLDDSERELVGELVKAIGSIAHGDVYSPGGIEGLTMAICGVGGPIQNESLSSATSSGLSAIAQAIGDGLAELAVAQRDGLVAIADAIKNHE